MHRYLAAVAVCAICAGTPAMADTFTLQEALGVAYETNPQLDAARANQRAVDEGVAQANAGWRPKINAGGAYGYQETTISGYGTIKSHPLSGQVEITQPIFRGGQTYAEVSRAKAQVRAGRAQLTAVEQSVLLDAVSAYMNVVRDMATVDLRQNNVRVLDRQRRETKEQFDAGALTRTDVSQSEARLEGARAGLIAAEAQLAASRAQFERVVGRPPETLEKLPPLPKLPNSEDAALQVALKQNPALLSARETAKAADYAVDDALGALMPSFAVTGQYQYQKGGYNTTGLGSSTLGTTARSAAILGQLNVPIYQGGADEAAVRQAKQFRSQAELNIAVSDRQVREAIRSAWENFAAAQATIKSNKAQVEADKIAFEGVRREQQVGGRTTLDVLNAEQELLNSQVAVVSSQRDAIVAAYRLLATTGDLTAGNLGLKVSLYDPKAYYDDNASRWIGLGD